LKKTIGDLRIEINDLKRKLDEQLNMRPRSGTQSLFNDSPFDITGASSSYATAAATSMNNNKEIKQLTAENKRLNSQIEELNAQLLRNSLETGRTLLHLTETSGLSLAAEIDTMSKDDVMIIHFIWTSNSFKQRDLVSSFLSFNGFNLIFSFFSS
jgi:hypothetical protein